MQYQVEVENLGKGYIVNRKSRAGATAEQWLQVFGFGRRSTQRDDTFWALKDVSFKVNPGERIGIIGHNGAGKSTLLKILSRVIPPTTGRAKLNGRVSSLLELGTGFHEELSGRDNIILSTSIYGLSGEDIKKKFDEIVEFAGINNFIDTPIKQYSSGMRMRLAFAVAVNLDPDILILDEVLTVGDIAFQQKCLNKISGLTSESRTLFLVSHSLGEITRFCQRVIWIDAGRIRYDGPISEGLAMYQSEMLGLSAGNLGDLTEFRGERKGTNLLKFSKVRLLNGDLTPATRICTGQSVVFELTFKANDLEGNAIKDLSAFVAIENASKQRLVAFPSEILTDKIGEFKDSGKFYCRVPVLPLVPGMYHLTISCHLNRQLVDKVVDCLTLNVYEGDFYGTGRLPLASMGEVCVPFSWTIQPEGP